MGHLIVLQLLNYCTWVFPPSLPFHFLLFTSLLISAKQSWTIHFLLHACIHSADGCLRCGSTELPDTLKKTERNRYFYLGRLNASSEPVSYFTMIVKLNLWTAVVLVEDMFNWTIWQLVFRVKYTPQVQCTAPSPIRFCALWVSQSVYNSVNSKVNPLPNVQQLTVVGLLINRASGRVM